ncbi:Sugar lactone lactonase YvrE [Fodinibius roseus]|uniref:Sugar lactone lactonase YvrE n=2 Tax=Fodinibius roseus TaxID=1194090 RepID=A0A1M5FL53_9BACT|nr:Sugar lactone lactonase YvrE [Fodinibius roseus]
MEYQHDATLGEGPVWDEREGRLYWVDILSGTLFRYDPLTNRNRAHDVGEHLGAIGLRREGGLVMALQSGFAFYDPADRQITPITDPEADRTGTRFNDGKSDPSGRFWAGTLSYELEKGAGSLYSLDQNLEVEVRLQDLTISNGMAWSEDRFFFIDTPTRQVMAFAYDQESGDIANPEVLRTVDEEEGYPDGMTIDREGALWVALYGGNKVIRIDPASGQTLFEVHLPVPQVTSCTFGGSEFRELYITTAREHMSSKEIQRWPLSGSLFKASVPFAGSPAHRFGG